MDRIETLFNDNWEFQVVKPGDTFKEDGFTSVNLPHDWLIYDCENLYADGTGYYKKSFTLHKKAGRKYYINFDGVYMDSTVYVNGKEAGVNRYGYSAFELDITDLLVSGENEIKAEIRHKSPNTRWYSGAGIFRDVTFIEVNDVHIASSGVYVFTELLSKDGVNGDRGRWRVTADVEVEGVDDNTKKDIDFDFEIIHKAVSSKAKECICRNVDFSDIPVYYYAENKANPDEGTQKVLYSLKGSTPYGLLVNDEYGTYAVFKNEFVIENGRVWDITSPETYEIKVVLKYKGETVDTYTTGFGLRTIEYTTDDGFFLNGRHVKINGVCEHHDFGLFGAAFNADAMRRKFTTLKTMGVNAVRTSHNMPAKKLMDLADEMGIMIDSEAFDMWRRPKTEFDYARFFEDNYKKDIRSWVRRDRNHPAVIMWSIGNEIYDCHADDTAPALTADMKKTVETYDYEINAPATHASNFMGWAGARNCADVLKMAGYNYGERLYDEQHKDHPDWKIYGSETCSTVQSRGIYHFPLSASVMCDDDEQCSSLGNCTTSWGAPSTEYVITMDRDRKYSQGQFLWTGFDYIGEPTPYHTKNSYFGQIDTAGFPKDTFYLFKSSWTDPKKVPFVHIFPYWDFNDGQIIDVRTATNCDSVELYFKADDKASNCSERCIDKIGDSDRYDLEGFSLIGKESLDHVHGNVVAPAWSLPYRKGTLKAIAYLDGKAVAVDEVKSFGDAVALSIRENFRDGDTVFLEINAVDAAGVTVENAASRVKVSVTGAGELAGLDNGDSTDNENYKCDCRRLFSGKLLAAVSTKGRKGELKVTASSIGLKPAEYVCDVVYVTNNEGDLTEESGIDEYRSVNDKIANSKTESIYIDKFFEKNIKEANNSDERQKEIPIRNIKLEITDGDQFDRTFNKERREITVKAEICPKDATYSDIKWIAVNEKAVQTNIVSVEPFETEKGHFAKLTAKGDGEFRLRALAYNGERVAKVISVLEFRATGLGKAFINPYEFVSGSLYTDSKGEIGNGNEKGIATPRGADSYFGFENIDFGEIGSDEITIPIFTLNDAEYKLGIWEGIPGAPGSTLLCDGRYSKKMIWNVYQPETYKLCKKLKGVTSIYFTADDKFHFKGFTFKEPDKAYEQLYLNQNSRIYGDTFTLDGECITGIGNNVTIEFDGMNFEDTPANKLVICGRSKLANNSIHLKFDGDEGTKTELLEFAGSDEYIERSFEINGAKGNNTVGFVFLPGCDFDFKYFKFLK